MMGLLVLYVMANFTVAVMLGCMLQSRFANSAWGFRWVVALLGASTIGCTFAGVELVAEAARAGLILAVAVIVMQAALLALLLVAMRLRQVSAGYHLHPREALEEREERLREWAGLQR
jgi:hypothetical protein